MYHRASQGATLPRRKNVRVTDGFRCAPDCLPHGEYMMLMAVSPIARPIRKRRSSGGWMTCVTGEAGCCSKVTQTQAESMNTPSPTASIPYSGQWCCKALRIHLLSRREVG